MDTETLIHAVSAIRSQTSDPEIAREAVATLGSNKKTTAVSLDRDDLLIALIQIADATEPDSPQRQTAVDKLMSIYQASNPTSEEATS